MIVKSCDQTHLKDVVNAICIQTIDGEAICVIFESDSHEHSSSNFVTSSQEFAESHNGSSNAPQPPSSSGGPEPAASLPADELETMVCGWDQGEELLVTLPLQDHGGAGLNVKQVGDFILIDPLAPFYPTADGRMGKFWCAWPSKASTVCLTACALSVCRPCSVEWRVARW